MALGEEDIWQKESAQCNLLLLIQKVELLMYIFNTLGVDTGLQKQQIAYIINRAACIANVWFSTEILPKFGLFLAKN